MKLKLDDTTYYAYSGNHAPDKNHDTIIFVHGTAMDHSIWSQQSRYFAYHGYNVLAIDLPGHNLSGGELLTNITAMAHWLLRIVECSVGPAIHLVGHSMGSLVALETAACMSPTVVLKSLSLLGFSYPMTVTPKLLDAAENDPSSAYSMMTQWSHASKIGGEPMPGFWSSGMQMSMLENSRPGAVFADLTACGTYSGGDDAFKQIQCPILFICGHLDKMTPGKFAAVHAEKNDNAEIVFIPNCGHNLMSESPNGVLHELKQFIGQQK